MSDTDAFSDLQIVARTLWGEARGLGQTGMRATACAIMNRLDSGISWWGSSIRDICLKPWQFSCWNKTDPNRQKLIDLEEGDPSYQTALLIAQALLDETLIDITDGATHYFNHITTPTANWPSWSKTHECCFIYEPHWFYRVVD